MSAKYFNPTGNPRRWQGTPGVKYPEEVAAARMAETEMRVVKGSDGATVPVCPPGYIELRNAALILHLSQATARQLMVEHEIPSFIVKPMFGCEYEVFSESYVRDLQLFRVLKTRKSFL